MQPHDTPQVPLQRSGPPFKQVPPKPCLVCGTPMFRGDVQKLSDFRKKKTCSETCRWEWHRKRYDPATGSKECSGCGVVFHPRPGEQQSKFDLRRTCSPECKVASMAKVKRDQHPNEKACLICGVIVHRRDNECPTDFNKKKTCGAKSCLFEAVVQTKARKYRRGSPYPEEFTVAFRESIRARDGHRCRLCRGNSGKRNLHVHHIDYNKQHCHPDNLITLCGSCHSKTHTNRDHWYAVLTAL